jgi:hypothetical protein
MQFIQKFIQIIEEEGFSSLKTKAYLKLNKKWKTFNRMVELSEWAQAIETGEVLLQKFYRDVDLNKKMAWCYLELGEDNLSSSYMRTALELKLKSDWDNIIKKIQQALGPLADITSTYEYIRGCNSIGIFEHLVESSERKEVSKSYITKIIPEKRLFEKESKFYLEICSRYPFLKNIIPEPSNITEARGLYFITMEKIIGKMPDEGNLDTIIAVSNLIGSIKYPDIIELLPAHEVSLPSKYSQYFIEFTYLFANIHKESSNIEVFNWLFERINTICCSDEIRKLVKRLKDMILDAALYKYIKPEEDYVLLHNDFHRENIFMEDNGSRCCVIDWEKYNIGPRGLDLVRFFLDFNPSFEVIHNLYLSKISAMDAKEHTGIIHQVFFLYPLLISYFVDSDADKLEKMIESHIQPAVEYIEKLAVYLPGDFISE